MNFIEFEGQRIINLDKVNDWEIKRTTENKLIVFSFDHYQINWVFNDDKHLNSGIKFLNRFKTSTEHYLTEDK